ncbi:MAG TPA: FkbM family methyltransferase [Acidimicrobiales bacterium]|nr:FkbM family methyltransferase [Acidimicrobiales bacterium]
MSGRESAWPVRSFQSMVGRTLDRYGLKPGRDIVMQINTLADDVGQMATEIRELRAVVDALNSSVTVLNSGSGELVLSRFRPVLTQKVSDPREDISSVLESVKSDVGPVLLPRFDRFILPSIRQTGAWEPDEMEYLRRKIQPGMTVLDIGANVGYSALVMARAAGEHGLVVAFEPEPLNFSLLCTNIRRNAALNVLPIHAAVGEVTGSITLQRSPDNSGDHRTAPHPFGIASLEVPLVAIDDLLPADLVVGGVMIDAQGYDHRVIRGMKRSIDQWRPFMLVEFWPLGILENGDDPDEVLDQYRDLNYRLELLPDQDVSSLSAEQILDQGAIGGRDHVTLSLVPA